MGWGWWSMLHPCETTLTSGFQITYDSFSSQKGTKRRWTKRQQILTTSYFAPTKPLGTVESRLHNCKPQGNCVIHLYPGVSCCSCWASRTQTGAFLWALATQRSRGAPCKEPQPELQYRGVHNLKCRSAAFPLCSSRFPFLIYPR